MRFPTEYTCNLMNEARHAAFGKLAAKMVLQSLAADWPKVVVKFVALFFLLDKRLSRVKSMFIIYNLALHQNTNGKHVSYKKHYLFFSLMILVPV